MAQEAGIDGDGSNEIRLTPNTDVGDLKDPDSTWLSDYKSKQWPVVICHREQTSKEFQNAHPPKDTHVPAILLGRHIL